MIYVISSNESKKNIVKTFKDKNYSVQVKLFGELVSDRNKKVKLKRQKVTEELYSTEFDTPLNSYKTELGLRDCLFIVSNDDILDFTKENYDLIEVV